MLVFDAWACVEEVKLAKKACSSGTYSDSSWKNGSRLCSTGRKFSSSGTVRSSVFLTSGRPLRPAEVSGPSAVMKLFKRGAKGSAAVRSGDSARSAERNSSRKGLATTANLSISFSAVRELREKDGSTRQVSA